jgi:hypothetical protein
MCYYERMENNNNNYLLEVADVSILLASVFERLYNINHPDASTILEVYKDLRRELPRNQYGERTDQELVSSLTGGKSDLRYTIRSRKAQ